MKGTPGLQFWLEVFPLQWRHRRRPPIPDHPRRNYRSRPRYKNRESKQVSIQATWKEIHQETDLGHGPKGHASRHEKEQSCDLCDLPGEEHELKCCVILDHGFSCRSDSEKVGEKTKLEPRGPMH